MKSDTVPRRKWKKRIIICTAIFVALLLCACIVAKIGYDMAFQRAGPQPDEAVATAGADHPRRAVEFNSGENLLRGFVYGETGNKGLVVISHGLGASSEGYFKETLFFVKQGWRVLAYDNTGTHLSEGKNIRGISQSLLDLDAALGYVASDEELNALPVVLYGHSWGGYAVTAILNWHPENELPRRKQRGIGVTGRYHINNDNCCPISFRYSSSRP